MLKPELDQWKPGEHNGTFRGHNLAFVTARAAIEEYWSDDEFAASVERKGAVIASKLEELAELDDRFSARGRGMMRGLDVSEGEIASKITSKCFADGLVIETSGADDHVVKILTPLTTSDAVLNDGLRILEKAVRSTVAELEAVEEDSLVEVSA